MTKPKFEDTGARTSAPYPGRIVQALKQAGAMNPVFMLDEIDKISVGYQGDPAAALLEVLDPAQNHSFRDHYLEINVDLSRVLFIATSNQLGTIHPALLDRMEILQLTGYSEEEKLQIARQYLIPRQINENGLTPDLIQFSDAAVRRIISDYTREAGVRSLERQIGAVCRKVAARVAAGNAAPGATVIEAGAIPDYLGPPRFHDEVAFRVSRPGVATGLAWTETGGDVLFIEASLLPSGHHELILTGPAGERHAGIRACGGEPHPREPLANSASPQSFWIPTICTCTYPPARYPKTVPPPA